MEEEDYRDLSDIDDCYVEWVDAYNAEEDSEAQLQMRNHFIDWFWNFEWRLTDAEKEYLQDNIYRVHQA